MLFVNVFGRKALDRKIILLHCKEEQSEKIIRSKLHGQDWFPNPETIRNELKKVPAFAVRGEFLRKHYANRLKNGLDLARRIGTPVSQSSDGELVLSIRNESYGKNDPEPVARTPIENWDFIRIDARNWIPLLATCKKRGKTMW